VAERLSEEEAQYVAGEYLSCFTHNEQSYRVRRDKWDELYAGNKVPQVNTGTGPVLPFPEDEEEGGEEEAPRPDPNEAQRQAAKSTMEDFTRNIQRKKEREMEALQFMGGDDSRGATPVVTGQKTGRNDPCPCGSGKKYKRCHGS
jgi:preprotein translocase subunit SecA